ncbi:beta-propeller fold lactonase family protein [Paenibacillus sacheonensis]|uniref:Beta-propeller fold lactonase family protein n=1 Tax=Paenibacillus sacheonensis TaxID=742054 RepID=A0A7X5BWV0_9BACL|nr:beta-propeller fold lactonase family protein [Paenibacillus sacheonensis]MBM7567405.1 YVTN family beta-propeller protein [Paenibacillus sacheonensis]NBC69813.1 beta-propeller fold lactonase family protein [Paenibacillus sacheonensis]
MGLLRSFFLLNYPTNGLRAIKLAAGACALAAMAFLSACTGNDGNASPAPQSGSSIVMSADGKTLYIANGDTNTVSVVDAKNRKVEKEIAVGKEPRELALSSDGSTLFVTCRYANSVEWLDIDKGKVLGTLKTGIEPYGIVLSPGGKTLYVTNYRSGTVSVVDAEKRSVLKQVKAGANPRAIAISADGGKLYVSDYLTSGTSIFETASMKLLSDKTLAPSPDLPDRKKSQGTPNTVEQLRLTPDGKSLWEAHLLTNTDTPVQFEEVIFPALSVVDAGTGEEEPKSRKELFKAIDVKDKLGKTIIVSNPTDVVFSADGKKGYALMGGSEDLLVFDLARGGRAGQIIHHLPGDLPIGMVQSKDGGKLYIHNASSHDLTVVSLPPADEEGGQARVDGKPLPLIAKDRLNPQQRLGKTLFYSANSDEYPLTGSNWMSCASCHSDGEVDQLSIMTAKGPRNVPSNVLAFDTGLFMWDGSRDDFGDYIHTVQGEMGGLSDVDPAKPLPAEAQGAFDALEAFMRMPDAFPVPQSPYRTEDGQLTEEAQRGKAIFEGKAQCVTCHASDVMTDSVLATGEDGKLTTGNTGFLHDVGTVNGADADYAGDARGAFKNTRQRGLFDTPTLRGVYATAPYLHDGSAPTLEDVIARAGDEHGLTSKLSPKEIKDLVSYLKQIQ